MKCVVPGANVKILARAIHALAKVGDEMYVQPQQNCISFRTVNMANSAYADFTFYENYFSYYIYGDLEADEALKCKISMRSAMAVFKAPTLLDKQVETCHIKFDPSASDILFILKYKNSISKVHLLPILDCEKIQADYNKDDASNQISFQPRVLGDAVQNFHQNLIEITFDVSPQKLLLRNYVDDTSGMSNTTRTQLALSLGEFDRYIIGNETTVTFCMKELRAILTFAEIVGVPISVHFETAGRPVIFVLKNPTFEANLVLSTVNPDSDNQTETTLVGKQEKSAKRRAPAKRAPRKTNKSMSRTRNQSVSINKTLENSTRKTGRTSVNVEERETLRDASSRRIIESKTNSFGITPIKEVFGRDTRVTSETREGHTSMQANRQTEFINSPSSSGVMSRSSKISESEKKIAKSIFSTITKRKSSVNDNTLGRKERDEDANAVEDAIPGSPPPPAKKARTIFQKCFQTTFDPRMLPGHDVVLAEDSDDYCSE